MYVAGALSTVAVPAYTCASMEKGRYMRVSLLAVLAVSFVLALGGTAFAQNSPTTDTYGGVLGNEVENSGSSTGSPAPPSNVTAEEGSLPFTGFQVGIVALAGIGLVGLGFAMRRGTRRPPAV
jgi:hypothetical protein